MASNQNRLTHTIRSCTSVRTRSTDLVVPSHIPDPYRDVRIWWQATDDGRMCWLVTRVRDDRVMPDVVTSCRRLVLDDVSSDRRCLTSEVWSGPFHCNGVGRFRRDSWWRLRSRQYNVHRPQRGRSTIVIRTRLRPRLYRHIVGGVRL